MVRKIVMCTALLCFVAGAALATDVDQERRPGPSISEWLKILQRKMEQIIPKKSIALSTGVAGVRGAKEDSRPRLYWKGKKSEEAMSEEELKEFQEGVEFASMGDKANAVRELEEFMRQFPDSQLIPDAKKTLDLVKQEPEMEAAPNGREDRPAAGMKEAAQGTGKPEGRPDVDQKDTDPAQ